MCLYIYILIYVFIDIYIYIDICVYIYIFIFLYIKNIFIDLFMHLFISDPMYCYDPTEWMHALPCVSDLPHWGGLVGTWRRWPSHSVTSSEQFSHVAANWVWGISWEFRNSKVLVFKMLAGEAWEETSRVERCHICQHEIFAREFWWSAHFGLVIFFS